MHQGLLAFMVGGSATKGVWVVVSRRTISAFDSLIVSFASALCPVV